MTKYILPSLPCSNVTKNCFKKKKCFNFNLRSIIGPSQNNLFSLNLKMVKKLAQRKKTRVKKIFFFFSTKFDHSEIVDQKKNFFSLNLKMVLNLGEH
jgi:hypothetical protein